MRNTTYVSNGSGTAYPSGAHEFIPPVFSAVRVIQYLDFCVVFFYQCLLFCLSTFSHCIVCLPKCTASDYPFGSLKLFLKGYYTLQGDNSLKSVERFDHMMFVCRF